MKKRYNITINESVMYNAKKYIKNVSAFLEVCLKNYLDKCIDNERKQNEKAKKIIDEYEQQFGKLSEDLKRQIEIASFDWINN